MKKQLLNALRVVLLLLMTTFTFAQAPPLGTAADFVIFTSVGAVTNVGTYKYLTYLTGNVGTNSGSSTNFGNVNGVMHDGDVASAQCAADLLLAYNSLSAAIPTFTLGPVIGNGAILTAGIYSMPGATSLNLDLILDAQGDANAVFILKTPSAVEYAFTANPNSKIKLINGAKACNVFLQVSGAVNIGAGATIRGNIIAHGAISMAAQDTIEGRALTVNGAITISNGALGFLAYIPIGCGSPVLTGPTPPTFVASGSYAVFASTGAATDCGTSRIIGDVGGNTVPPTGFNPDSITGTIHFNDPSTNAAAADLLLVYNYLLALPYDIKLLDPAEFGHNLVLTPHTYQMDAAVTFTDTLYLDAQGNPNAVFVIKTFGAFASTPNAKVILINGTQAKNVYWFCTGAVSIAANSIFKGAIIAHDAIEMLPGAKLDGRVFSTHGALTTCGITATLPSLISSGPNDQTVCEGTAVNFIISATGTGLNYQWRKGSIPLIDGGNISGATNDTLIINPVYISDAAPDYNVIVSGAGIQNDTSSNAFLVVNPLPMVYNLTGGGGYCTGGNGVSIGLSGSATGINYELFNGILPVITLPGTGNALDFGLQTVVGTYTVTATDALTLCAVDMSGNTTVTINPLPDAFTVTGGGSYCSGGVGVSVGLSGSATGINYTLYNGTVSVITLPGTGSLINFGLQTLAGTYTVVATNASTTCTRNMIGSAVVTVNPLPMVFNVTGGGAYCYGGAGVAVGLSGSVVGINYSLYNGTEMIISLPGTGAALNFGLQTLAGSYTVKATNSISNCFNMMNGMAMVTINILPMPNLSGLADICENSQYYYTTDPGMSGYVWTISSGGVIIGPSDGNVVNVLWTVPGNQSVSVIYANAYGCYPAGPTTLDVTVNPLPDDATDITGSTIVCAGEQGVAYSTNPIPNATNYIWTLPSGASIASGSGTPSITVNFANDSPSGNVTVYGENLCGGGETSRITVMVNPLPSVPGNINGEGIVCEGSTGVIYSIEPLTDVINYKWTLPTGATIISGANTNTIIVDFSLSAISGNISVYGSNSCGNGETSPVFEVTVNPIPVTPVVTANGIMVSSSAPVGNQWYFNGTMIAGATNQSYQAMFSGWYWTVVTLNGCISESSNQVYVIMVGLPELVIGDVNVYPVPNDGKFTVSITSPYLEPFTITVFSYLGVRMLEFKDIIVIKHLDKVIDLRPAVNGVYYVVIQNKSINFNKIKKVVVNK